MTNARKPLKIGLVGLMNTYFKGDQPALYAKTIASLEKLSSDWGFELYPIRHGLYSSEEGQAAARELADQEIGFLLVQATGFSLGEYAHLFADLGYPLGFWSIPEGPSAHGVGLPLNSFTAMNMYNSILGLYRQDYSKPVKWFYGEPNESLFLDRFLVTVQALRAKTNLEGSTVALVGGVATGFDNQIVDERDLKEKLGVNLVTLELDPLLQLANKYDNKVVEETAARIKADAVSFETGMESALMNSARVYLACREPQPSVVLMQLL